MCTTQHDGENSQEWRPVSASISSIKSLFSNSSGSHLYVCASNRGWKDQIFKLKPEAETSGGIFSPITEVPSLLRQGIKTSSLFQTFPTVRFSASHDRIYTVQCNGWDSSVAAAYDLVKKTWLEKTVLPFTCWDCSCVCINDSLYVLGGGMKSKSADSTSATNLVALPSNESTWKTHLPFVTPDFAKLAVDRDDHLIAVGGREHYGEASTTAAIFDWPARKWMPLPSMLSGHCGHGVCVTANNNLIVVGGCLNNMMEFLSVPEAVISHSCG